MSTQPESEDDAALDDWVTRTLRAAHWDEHGEFDPEAAIARYHEGVRRMETDPEYAAHIRRLAEEADAETDAAIAAEQHEAEREGFDSHGVSGYEL